MRLLFVRHGDPDYVHDTLTAKGRREAALLAGRAEALGMEECFVSPLGRAKDTAAYSLKKLGRTAETLDWLREFPARIDLNVAQDLQCAYPGADMKDGKYIPRIVWDVAPAYWMEHEELMDAARWRKSDICTNSDAVEVFERVTKAFDEFLAKYGYVRSGIGYRVEKENTKTVTFFCHFGITCALLAHLWNQSPFAVWQALALAPTSVTELVTEERQKGFACFRGLKIGDVTHLHMGEEPVSFAARFCEVYSDMSQRH